LKILLDENFPLALYHSLKSDGEDVAHIITLGLRGAPDQHIRERLFERDVLFLTHDEDFLFDRPTEAIVVLSRVRQSRRLVERVEVWRSASLTCAGIWT
jgi:predicted nuclease of predicted toxin-antitoxin system